jgi:hypothetical protein
MGTYHHNCALDNSKKRKVLEYRCGERKVQVEPSNLEKDTQSPGLDIPGVCRAEMRSETSSCIKMQRSHLNADNVHYVKLGLERPSPGCA